MLGFLRENARWLGAGFLLTFLSGFGQTWFISLFAEFIKQAHGLSDGGWGSLYTAATLMAAALMFWRGSLADHIRLARLAPVTMALFACSALGLAFADAVWLLGVSLFGLRLCGQGMCSHLAMTAMGRWFEARRGRAVSIANLGHPAGEVVLPVLAVLAIAAIGWRQAWVVSAAILLFAAGPGLALLLRAERAPSGTSASAGRPGLGGRQWQRADAARHWLAPALLPVLLTPGFIGTVVFFQQAHVAQVKDWSLVAMAPGYTAYAGANVVAAFIAGWAADRFGPHRLLPLFLIPMGLGIALIGPAGQVAVWYLALGAIGITQGMASALWGVLLPAVYGTRHLGAIRSLATTIMVVSTAIGPGITGVLIDQGIAFPTQSLFMGAWCLCLALASTWTMRRLSKELATDEGP